MLLIELEILVGIMLNETVWALRVHSQILLLGVIRYDLSLVLLHSKVSLRGRHINILASKRSLLFLQVYSEIQLVLVKFPHKLHLKNILNGDLFWLLLILNNCVEVDEVRLKNFETHQLHIFILEFVLDFIATRRWKFRNFFECLTTNVSFDTKFLIDTSKLFSEGIRYLTKKVFWAAQYLNINLLAVFLQFLFVKGEVLLILNLRVIIFWLFLFCDLIIANFNSIDFTEESSLIDTVKNESIVSEINFLRTVISQTFVQSFTFACFIWLNLGVLLLIVKIHEDEHLHQNEQTKLFLNENCLSHANNSKDWGMDSSLNRVEYEEYSCIYYRISTAL